VYSGFSYSVAAFPDRAYSLPLRATLNLQTLRRRCLDARLAGGIGWNEYGWGIVLLAGIYINLFGLWLYRKPSEVARWPGLQRWVAQFEFSPETLGGFSYSRLALISLFGLFLELLMIRWISSEITIFAYFKNFVLVACYLGFGLGCYMSRRPINLMALCVPLVALGLLCDFPLPGLRSMVTQLTTTVGAISQVDYWGVPSLPLGGQSVAAALSAGHPARIERKAGATANRPTTRPTYFISMTVASFDPLGPCKKEA
jgi:hypothetical protein